ncbi:hypothetical protein NDU88_004864 [Pleurodeles waltl]|uniref:Uncharacterized protein n=1 Tax=Pleurodeles waltl TaxID=8319 RepID=A0AAV7WZI8_PLEWA|nr:hypothetical protein NDU88_004864 [Pleurodeles waltl]
MSADCSNRCPLQIIPEHGENEEWSDRAPGGAPVARSTDRHLLQCFHRRDLGKAEKPNRKCCHFRPQPPPCSLEVSSHGIQSGVTQEVMEGSGHSPQVRAAGGNPPARWEGKETYWLGGSTGLCAPRARKLNRNP